MDAVIQAVGVQANLDGALADSVKLETDRGFLVVDGRYQTNVEGIYAAGDIIGPPTLAHVATYEAIQAVNGMFPSQRTQAGDQFSGLHLLQSANRQHRSH